MFSTIDTLIDLPGARVVDLYAGSGALGLEAASRGASRVTLVDSSRLAVTALRRNATTISQVLGGTCTIDVVPTSALAFCRSYRDTPLDLVLVDPPYDTDSDEIIECITQLTPHLTPESLVVVERAKKTPSPSWPKDWEAVKEKTYGDTRVFYLFPRR
jgi:16S rRNA (guanine966-N2)-methyltransferase